MERPALVASSPLPCRYIANDLLLENVERQRAFAQHRFVKIANIEARAKLTLGVEF